MLLTSLGTLPDATYEINHEGIGMNEERLLRSVAVILVICIALLAYAFRDTFVDAIRAVPAKTPAVAPQTNPAPTSGIVIPYPASAAVPAEPILPPSPTPPQKR